MTAPSLAAFLLARIEEEEAVARAWDANAECQAASVWTGGEPGYVTVASGRPGPPWIADGREVDDARRVQVLLDPARLLADCKAKRAIVERSVGQMRLGDQAGPWSNWRDMAEDNLRDLAQPYASHPDFRDEWR